ncbi:MAG: hypothetical protein Q8O42_09495 [Acidobacteriota bacterium]|nr:hypothetical protein [Acidobacteriota bacterium]
MADEVTVGEVYRRLVDMDERYETKLDRIEAQVRTTNGRTTTLEANAKHVASSLRAIWSRINGTPHTPTSLPSAEPGESFGVKISPGMWKALAAAGGALATLALPRVAEWLQKLGGS